MGSSSVIDVVLQNVLGKIRECRGVLAVKALSELEKKRISEVESQVENKIVYGMCKSLNQGVRESLQRDFVVAMVIQTSEFQYPHHPYMNIMCGDQVIGELVSDKEKIDELKQDPSNVFLWDNFVVDTRRLPRDPEKRRQLRLVYLPREPLQLTGLEDIENAVFGTPSTEGDKLIKGMLDFKSNDSVTGTCLVGFDVLLE